MGKRKGAAEAPQEQQQGTGGGQSGNRAPPAHEVRIGRIRGVCWRNDGKDGVWYSVQVSRSFKDNSDPPQWKQSTSLGRDDLLVAAEILRLCWLWIAHQNGSKLDGSGHAGEQTGGDDIPI